MVITVKAFLGNGTFAGREEREAKRAGHQEKREGCSYQQKEDKVRVLGCSPGTAAKKRQTVRYMFM